MPHFWQIKATEWINPAHIVHVEDQPRANPPFLVIWMLAVETGEQSNAVQPYVLKLDGAARDTVLAYLARETESAPPPAPE